MTNTTNDNILNVMYNKHRILIDNISEYDYNGDLAVVKKMCTVIAYHHYSDGEEIATPNVLPLSPYMGLMDMDIAAKQWIDKQAKQ